MAALIILDVRVLLTWEAQICRSGLLREQPCMFAKPAAPCILSDRRRKSAELGRRYVCAG